MQSATPVDEVESESVPPNSATRLEIDRGPMSPSRKFALIIGSLYTRQPTAIIGDS